MKTYLSYAHDANIYKGRQLLDLLRTKVFPKIARNAEKMIYKNYKETLKLEHSREI